MKKSKNKLTICANCSHPVDVVYQKGYCKKCVVTLFHSMKHLLNESHALYSSDTTRKNIK